jgi:protein-disulfide isomerase
MKIVKIVLCLCVAAAALAFLRENKSLLAALQAQSPGLSSGQEAVLGPYLDGHVKLAELPLEQAIKEVRGDGSLVVVTFEDPRCRYCKALDKELARLDNVTHYTFLYPVLSEDSWRLSRQVWCAPDRARAWNDLMLRGRSPTGQGSCDTRALARNLEYGAQKWKIRGVPFVLQAHP